MQSDGNGKGDLCCGYRGWYLSSSRTRVPDVRCASCVRYDRLKMEMVLMAMGSVICGFLVSSLVHFMARLRQSLQNVVTTAGVSAVMPLHFSGMGVPGGNKVGGTP